MFTDYCDDNAAKSLPDILAYGLKILFIGFNPGILSAKTRHHYAHKSNRFWKLLYDSGLLDKKLSAQEDRDLLKYGYGSTNIVDRPTVGTNEIKSNEYEEGSHSLLKLIQEVKPKIACYTGIGVYRAYYSSISCVPAGKIKINTGLQKNKIVESTMDFVCSSTSGLNTIPYSEQLKCFQELKKLVNNL